VIYEFNHLGIFVSDADASLNFYRSPGGMIELIHDPNA
jgi:catechol 2,3-dioxygenase-like lactoylglutathione lyase family enzyme